MNVDALFKNLFIASKKVEVESFFTIAGKELEGIKEILEMLADFKGCKITILETPEDTVVTSNYKHTVFNKEVKLYSISVIDTGKGLQLMFRLTADSFENMR